MRYPIKLVTPADAFGPDLTVGVELQDEPAIVVPGDCAEAGATASPQAVAQALMKITSFKLLLAGSTAVALGDVSTYSFNAALRNVALCGSAGWAEAATGSGTTAAFPNIFVSPIDPLIARVGDGSSSEDDYATATLIASVPPAGSSFARGDSQYSGAPWDHTPFQGTIANTLTLNAAAEVVLDGVSKAGSASGGFTNVSSISFTANHAIGAFGFSFTAETYLRAWTNSGSGAGTLAGAGFNFVIQLKQGNTVLMQWAPNGSTSTGTQTGLTVGTEDCTLNAVACASNSDPQDAVTHAAQSFVAHSSVALVSDTVYTLLIAQTANAMATTASA